MHYYKFNIADYRKDTTHLSMLEHGIYRTLIDWYYLDEKPIPLDVEMVARRMRLSTEDDLKSLKLVLFDFFEKTDKGHKHSRINVEILGYHELAIKNAANGKLGGRPLKTQTVTSGNPNESDRKGNHQPINQEPIIEDAIASLSGTTFPPCPHKELIDLYSKHLPHLPKPRIWEGTRKACMRQRWCQAGKPSTFSKNGYSSLESGLVWWDSFFSYIANDTKLSRGYESNGRVWTPDLPWIVNSNNFAKIIDGKYSK